jgi:hypothetical protein
VVPGKAAWVTVATNCIGVAGPPTTCGKIEIVPGPEIVGRTTPLIPPANPNEAVGRFTVVVGVLVGVLVGVGEGVGIGIVGAGVGVVGVGVGIVGMGVMTGVGIVGMGVMTGVGIVGMGVMTDGGIIGPPPGPIDRRARPSSGSTEIDALLLDRRPVAGRRLCSGCGFIVCFLLMRM